MSDREISADGSRSRSASRHSVKRSDGKRRKSKSPSRSKSRSRSRRRASRSRSRGRKYSRSRSRSYGRRKHRSRSVSYDRKRSSKNDRYGYANSRSRSPMSGRRRHIAEREHPRTSRCLGVFGLSLYTQERDLREIFERYGPIDDLQIVYDHQTGRSRGFAFIYMKNLEDAIEAKEMAPGQDIDGRTIRVDYSITERAHTPTPGIYLGKPASSGYSRSRRSRSPHYGGGGGGGGGRRPVRYSRSYSRSRSPSYRRY